MNNQKISTSLHQEFVRKPKRRQSPKHKNQNLYQFKCPHKENINIKQKEEYHLNQNQHIKNDTEIVLDLKQQLSHLKQQVAKIAHSKLQSAQTENNPNKLKMLDYYFPDKSNKKSDHTPTSLKNEISKTQANDLSLQKQMNKLRSKERLKFSKLKKVDKFSPISSVKKKQVDGSSKSIQSEQIIKQEESKRKKSGDESTLEEDFRKISLQHKSRLQQKINSIVFDQENISINIEREKSIKQSKQSSSSLGTRAKQIVSPRGNLGSSQIRINKLKKQIVQQQTQIDTLKRVIKEKNDFIAKYQIELQQSRKQISHLKTQNHTQQIQITTLRKQLSQVLQNKKNKQIQQKNLKQFFTQVEQQNTKIKQQLQRVTHQLKNRQLEIIKLQKLNKNFNAEIDNIKNQNIKIIDTLKKQFTLKQNTLLQEINKSQKIIKQLKQNNRPKQLTIGQNQSSIIKINKQEQSLVIPIPNSPRSNITPTNRQRQLLNVIRLHEKSLQNYQKDLSFLQSECKNLHHFKILSKKQQNLIKQTNHILITQQLTKLNNKYQKRPLSFSPTPKQLPKKSTK